MPKCHRRQSVAFLLCIAALAPQFSFAQVANDNSFTSMLFERVVKDILPPGQNQGAYADLQINTVPVAFSSDPTFETYTITNWVDVVAPSGSIFKSTPNRLTQQYAVFIKSLGIPSTDAKLAPQLAAAQKKYNDASDTYNKFFNSIDSKYKKFHDGQVAAKVAPEDQYSRSTWLSMGTGKQLAIYDETRAMAGQDWLALAGQASAEYRELASAVLAYDDIGNRRNVRITDSSDTALIRAFTASPSIKEVVEQAATVAGEGHSWTYARDSGWKTTETNGGGGSVSVFGISLGGGGNKTTVNTGKDLVGFKLSFKHWAKVKITPGNWFNSALITSYAHGPFAKASGLKSAEDADRRFWSKQTGAMPWMVSELVIVYQPTISITMSHDTYNSVHTQWSGSAGISVGPFSFGGSGGGSKDDIHWDDSSNTLTLNGPARPQVIAVIETELPLFH